MPELKISVHAQSETAARTRISARGFSILVDEPLKLGGTDAGPNPVEFLLAALAGCLNVVGHRVAREMGFSLQGLEIELEGALNPARLMNRPTEDRAGFKIIQVCLKPACDADEATLAEWLKIVESRCPVSDNIGHATPVKIAVQKTPFVRDISSL